MAFKQSSILCISVCQLTTVDYVEMTFFVVLYYQTLSSHNEEKCVRNSEITQDLLADLHLDGD